MCIRGRSIFLQTNFEPIYMALGTRTSHTPLERAMVSEFPQRKLVKKIGDTDMSLLRFFVIDGQRCTGAECPHCVGERKYRHA